MSSNSIQPADAGVPRAGPSLVDDVNSAKAGSVTQQPLDPNDKANAAPARTLLETLARGDLGSGATR